MIEIWEYFANLEPWMVPVALALTAVGVIIPFRALLAITGFSRRVRLRYFVIINPIVEEIIFRLFILGFAIITFGLLEGIVIMTVLYMSYQGVVYGPPHVADAFIIGIFFSLAMFEFGFLPILLAHMLYRLLLCAW